VTAGHVVDPDLPPRVTGPRLAGRVAQPAEQVSW
jgi:hypothetical protein